MQSHTQAGNITNNHKVEVYFTLPALSAKNVMTWKYHVYDSSKGRYDMILGRDILIELILNLKFSEHVIKSGDGPFKGSTTPMVDLGTYRFKDLNPGKITPEEQLTNDYVKELYESEHLCTATKRFLVILYSNCEEAYLHKVMENQCQNLTIRQRNELLELLHIFEEFFM